MSACSDAETRFQAQLNYLRKTRIGMKEGFSPADWLQDKHVKSPKTFRDDVAEYIDYEEMDIANPDYYNLLLNLIKAHAATQKACAKTGGKSFKFPRRFTRKHCMSKPCRRMGFTEKASCRPYKNCYRK